MTPFVARQCHVPGRLSFWSGLRAPRRLWQPAIAPCTPVRRAYSTGLSSRPSEHAVVRRLNSALLIPSAVHAAQPEDFIQQIHPVHWKDLDQRGLAVFFLTPSFARWLHNDETFLKKALDRIYPPVETSSRVYTLVAVVDKLPAPQHLNANVLTTDLVQQRKQHPSVWDTGLEGVAYTVMNLADSSSSVARTQQDQKGTLSFVFSHGSRTDTLELPLANTVFQTGSTTTMALSTWEWGPEKNFVLKEKSDLVHQAMHIRESSPEDQNISVTSIPLIPLTTPRVVEASMGNILRRITGSGGKSITASEELEKVVPQYFAARGQTPQSILVWALLIPHALQSSIESQTNTILQKSQTSSQSSDLIEPWRSLWTSDPPAWNGLVEEAIDRGARLHRVISGGGGWGKKAGLLSLDPSTNGLPHEDLSTESFADGPGDLSSALQEIVRPGDSIQFFASPIPTDTIPADEEALRHLDTEAVMHGYQSVWGWEIGTVPSTVDATPNSLWQHNNMSASSHVYVTRNCFGALAEGGMTIRRHDVDSNGVTTVVGKTQIDVPFSRFSLARVSISDHQKPGKKAKEEGVSIWSFASDSIDTSSTPVPVQSAIEPQVSPQAATQKQKRSSKGADAHPSISIRYLDAELKTIADVTKQQSHLVDQVMHDAHKSRRNQIYQVHKLIKSLNIRHSILIADFDTCWNAFMIGTGRKEAVELRSRFEHEYRKIRGEVWLCSKGYVTLKQSSKEAQRARKKVPVIRKIGKEFAVVRTYFHDLPVMEQEDLPVRAEGMVQKLVRRTVSNARGIDREVEAEELGNRKWIRSQEDKVDDLITYRSMRLIQSTRTFWVGSLRSLEEDKLSTGRSEELVVLENVEKGVEEQHAMSRKVDAHSSEKKPNRQGVGYREWDVKIRKVYQPDSKMQKPADVPGQSHQSAVEVYNLHVALRRCLSDMIRFRRLHTLPSKAVSSTESTAAPGLDPMNGDKNSFSPSNHYLEKLEDRLLSLRSYYQVFFPPDHDIDELGVKEELLRLEILGRGLLRLEGAKRRLDRYLQYEVVRPVQTAPVGRPEWLGLLEKQARAEREQRAATVRKELETEMSMRAERNVLKSMRARIARRGLKLKRNGLRSSQYQPTVPKSTIRRTRRIRRVRYNPKPRRVRRVYKTKDTGRGKVRRGVRESRARRELRQKWEREQEEITKLKNTVKGWLKGL